MSRPQSLVVVIVFSDKVECGSLQTHIDVFGHQDDVAVFDAFLQTFHHGQNLVVGFALRQHRKLHIKGLGLNKQTTGCFTVIQRYPEGCPYQSGLLNSAGCRLAYG